MFTFNIAQNDVSVARQMLMNNFLKKNDDFCSGKSLTFSGSDQAREGRLVDALAVRGDEGRDTLR